MTRPYILAQLTDLHLLDQPHAELRGCLPWHRLQMVLRQLTRHRPDGLLLTGDLADQGSAAAYAQLRHCLEPLSLPIYWLPGNHDHRSVARSVLSRPRFATGPVIALGAWRLVLLDSVLPTARWGEGNLAADQLAMLTAALATHRDRPTLVALHHHPVPTHIDWLDQMPVQNAAAFRSLLAAHPQVRLVLFGHIHQALQRDHPRPGEAPPLTFYGCPSTCLQVPPAHRESLDHLPGFRLLHLYPDGQHQTQIERVPLDAEENSSRAQGSQPTIAVSAPAAP